MNQTMPSTFKLIPITAIDGMSFEEDVVRLEIVTAWETTEDTVLVELRQNPNVTALVKANEQMNAQLAKMRHCYNYLHEIVHAPENKDKDGLGPLREALDLLEGKAGRVSGGM